MDHPSQKLADKYSKLITYAFAVVGVCVGFVQQSFNITFQIMLVALIINFVVSPELALGISLSDLNCRPL